MGLPQRHREGPALERYREGISRDLNLDLEAPCTILKMNFNFNFKDMP
jgi:hypothetical protein